MTRVQSMAMMVLLCVLSADVVDATSEVTSISDFILTEAEQERILDLFQATREKISPDGTLELTYDFETEDRSLGDDWFPSPAVRSAQVRWSRNHEGFSEGVSGGVIISDSGQWFHDAVWQPDVRVDATYVSFLGGSRGDMVSAVFAWGKSLRQRVGSNLGTQLVRISGTKAVGGMGKAPVICYEEHTKFGFELKNGSFSSLLNGYAKHQSDSKKLLKNLDTGQVGFIWRGTINGIVPKLKITGKIDIAWAAQQIPSLQKRIEAHQKK